MVPVLPAPLNAIAIALALALVDHEISMLCDPLAGLSKYNNLPWEQEPGYTQVSAVPLRYVMPILEPLYWTVIPVTSLDVHPTLVLMTMSRSVAPVQSMAKEGIDVPPPAPVLPEADATKPTAIIV